MHEATRCSGSGARACGQPVMTRYIASTATYGGHLELSAFAHMTKRNVKIIQPGLVYVIEWNTGWEGDSNTAGGAATQQATNGMTEDLSSPISLQDSDADQSQKKMTRRERKRTDREKSVLPEVAVHDGDGEPLGPVYVA